MAFKNIFLDHVPVHLFFSLSRAYYFRDIQDPVNNEVRIFGNGYIVQKLVVSGNNLVQIADTSEQGDGKKSSTPRDNWDSKNVGMSGQNSKMVTNSDNQEENTADIVHISCHRDGPINLDFGSMAN